MKNKVFSLLVFGIFALAIFASFASATVSITSVQQLSKTGTSTLNVTGTATETITFTLTSITEDEKTITFSTPATIASATGSPETVTITPTIPLDFNFYFGKTYSTILTANGTLSGISTQTLSFAITDPTLYQNNGHLITTIDSSDATGYGSDNEWYPFDKISARINVENNGPEKVSSIVVSYGLYDSTKGDWVVKDSASSFSLNDGNEKTITVDFQIDSLSKLNRLNADSSDDYVFYAWATGRDAFITSGENRISSFDSEVINLAMDDDFIILNNIQFTQSPIACGSQAEVTADVVNIGGDDKSGVAVKIYNAALGINQKVMIGDIDSLEKGKLDFTFNIPQDANEGEYSIYFTPVNSNGDQFESSNNDVSSATGTLNVSGSCVFNPKLTVTASSTEANAGKEVSVTATIVNTATTARTFLITATNYDIWATLTSVSPATLTLSPGQTKEVLVKLNINADVSGEQTFNVQLTGDGKIIPQPVTITVQKAPGFFNFLTGNVVKGNWYLWAIGGLNVLLLLIIVIVAVRVSRKK